MNGFQQWLHLGKWVHSLSGPKYQKICKSDFSVTAVIKRLYINDRLKLVVYCSLRLSAVLFFWLCITWKAECGSCELSCYCLMLPLLCCQQCLKRSLPFAAPPIPTPPNPSRCLPFSYTVTFSRGGSLSTLVKEEQERNNRNLLSGVSAEEYFMENQIHIRPNNAWTGLSESRWITPLLFSSLQVPHWPRESELSVICASLTSPFVCSSQNRGTDTVKQKL